MQRGRSFHVLLDSRNRRGNALDEINVNTMIINKRSYFQLIVYSQGVATCLIWQIFTPDALPDTTLKPFVFPPGTELGTFYLSNTLRQATQWWR